MLEGQELTGSSAGPAGGHSGAPGGERLEALLARSGVSVVYDGLCPFCSAYTHMLRLRESAGPVRLVDARAEPALVADLRAAGAPVNEGMAVIYAGRLYYGSDAVHVLALLASRSGAANRLVANLLRHERLARLAYPVLRAGRNLGLRLLGRPPI
jgi:predicted DCC family thiol-disulfide oxidoreductase YuxK